MIRMLAEMLKFHKNAEGRTGKSRMTDPLSAGLTLVELIIVMILSLVLVGSAFMAYLAHHKTSGEQSRVVALQQDLRAVMEMIERDVRNSGCHDPRFAVNVPAITASSSGLNSLALNMDLNRNGTINDQGEQIRYRLNGTTLEMRNQATTLSLLANVTTFGIIYRGLNDILITPAGTLTPAQAASVISVVVTLGIQSATPDPNTGRPVTRTMIRRVQSRNLEIIQKHMG
jgi:type II secretory pathway component PulJ